MSAFSAGPAAQQPPHQQYRAPHCAVQAQGFYAVFGAGRLETARWRPTGTDLALVDPDCRDEALRYRRFRCFGCRRVAGWVEEHGDQAGRGKQCEDKAVAVQAFADATTRFQQTGITQTRSCRCRPVATWTFPSARRWQIGVVRVVAIVVSSSAPSHLYG